jgi:hypothetical protein
MARKVLSSKVECVNPRTGRKMQIEKQTYDLISKAIYHSLNAGKALTYTQMVEAIYGCFKEQGAQFEGSVEWYAVTVKNDMEVRGIIQTVTEKGKKLHRLSK